MDTLQIASTWDPQIISILNIYRDYFYPVSTNTIKVHISEGWWLLVIHSSEHDYWCVIRNIETKEDVYGKVFRQS